MGVADRLRELRMAGKHELVVTLASEVLRKESPEVTVVDGRVRVSTRTFVGDHALDGVFDPSDRASVRGCVERRGTYRLRDPDEEMEGFTFTSGCHHDTIVDSLSQESETEARAAPLDDSEATPAAGSAPGPNTETTVRADGGEADRRGRTTGESTSILQQAVVAVQNQFRE